MTHVYDSTMVFRLLPPSPRRRRGWRRTWVAQFAALSICSLLSHSSVARAKNESKDAAQSEDSEAPTEPESSTETNEESRKVEPDASASVSVDSDANTSSASFALASGEMKPTLLFVDFGFRSDISLLYQRTTVGRFKEQEDFDVKAYGPMIHVGMLTKMFWKLRIGAALGYGFHYELDERLTEFEIEEELEPDRWVLGQLYTGDIRLEFSQLLTKNLYVLATPRGGVQAVIPGEHLLAERETYEGAYNVRTGPQWGVFGGFDLGARYLIFDWLSARISGGYVYYTQGLLKAKRKSDTVEYTALWRLSGARVSGNLGVEAVF